MLAYTYIDSFRIFLPLSLSSSVTKTWLFFQPVKTPDLTTNLNRGLRSSLLSKMHEILFMGKSSLYFMPDRKKPEATDATIPS
jgi:hypothetical protein